ncbi:hypothetical protein [Planomonospora venezuelensis]|uniref:Polyhydroxyalkanoate synthesis regulator phasin n=1 Tax=Planomonospora venezuelensis TaxID=1999 RepID=A0A841D4T8_PLAVE|nr:hypothetical protein [Planomonospora venezuelensis]MBB5963504.1 polyhydroxyalkanoate synthesis regulator phasin [Planomonospora venezuelensis]
MTTSKATAIVRELLASGENGLSQMSGQVDKLARELVSTGKANRDQLNELVRAEVDRLLGRLDLARAEDLDRLGSRIAELEARLAAVGGRPASQAAAPQTAAPQATAPQATAPQTAASRAVTAETASAIKAVTDEEVPVAKPAKPVKTTGTSSRAPGPAVAGAAAGRTAATRSRTTPKTASGEKATAGRGRAAAVTDPAEKEALETAPVTRARRTAAQSAPAVKEKKPAGKRAGGDPDR